MRRALCVSIVTLAFASAPALAFAQAVPRQSIRQLAMVAAKLEAQVSALQSGQSLACAALTSAAHVKAGEPFVLAWGSLGAMANGEDPHRSMWPQVGSAEIVLHEAGTWVYPFTFYAENGATTSCTTSITVTE